MEPQVKTPQPRTHHEFDKMKVNYIKEIPITPDDPKAGDRARSAAYAYGRRNGQQFCGAIETFRGKDYMVIRRVK